MQAVQLCRQTVSFTAVRLLQLAVLPTDATGQLPAAAGEGGREERASHGVGTEGAGSATGGEAGKGDGTEAGRRTAPARG